MKILIISKCPTHPVTKGNRFWILSQVELLKKLGNDIHFLYIYESPLKGNSSNEDTLKEMKAYWKENYHQFDISLYEKIYFKIINEIRIYLCNYTWKCDDGYPHNLHKTVNLLDEKYHFDCCIVNYFYLTKVFEKIHIPKKALSTHDCFTFKNLEVKKEALNRLTEKSEAKAMQRSPYIFALQDEEAKFFQKLSPKSKIFTVYGFYNYHEQACCYNKNILFFSGNNTYNINGLKWFLNQIYPFIISAFPDVKLIIGGGICKILEKEGLNYPNIELQGFVDNPDNFFQQGDIAINPTFQGTGLKIKTFESLSYGKIVMVHPHSMKGIYQSEKAPLFASEKANEWVTYLNKIWSSPESIPEIKMQDKIYLNKMNEFIENEYKRFLTGK